MALTEEFTKFRTNLKALSLDQKAITSQSCAVIFSVLVALGRHVLFVPHHKNLPCDYSTFELKLILLKTAVFAPLTMSSLLHS